MEDYMLTEVKAGGKYTSSPSATPPTCRVISTALLIRVDTEYRKTRTTRLFSVPIRPFITEGFDNDELQNIRSGEKKYRIMAFAELKKFTVSVGGDSYDAAHRHDTRASHSRTYRQIQHPN